jgi:hypothetical protein
LEPLLVEAVELVLRDVEQMFEVRDVANQLHAGCREVDSGRMNVRVEAILPFNAEALRVIDNGVNEVRSFG